MATNFEVQDDAARALEMMRAAGFDDAQVTAVNSRLQELNIAHNEPSLLRSTETTKLQLLGIVDGRMASTETADLSPEAVRSRIGSLFSDARAAPQDEANAVSAAQHARIVQGPQDADLEMLATAVGDLLAWRAANTPRMMVDEGDAKHQWQRWHTLTTRGSDLAASIGCYGVGVFGTAREGSRSSSFNYTGGAAHDLSLRPVQELFGIADMLRDTERQIETQPLPGKFTGDVVFMPNAVDDVFGWLMGQLGDQQLIAGSSLYRDAVGTTIASPLLTIRSRFDAPGVAAISGDAFAAAPVTVLEDGMLRTLTPTFYGSRKTGLPHTPVAGGWGIAAGTTSLQEMIGNVKRGALVGRLSMGMPAANGNFSSVIKNSFLIEDGRIGPALSEAMIAGNMAQMLRDIAAVSREVIDSGPMSRPWLHIRNLHFS
jgi:PmbA protein